MSAQHSAVLRALMERIGARPLLVLTPQEGDGPLPVLALSVSGDGQRLILGIVDTDGDNAVLSLTPEALRAIADAITGWLVDR